jgi:hypothetical protein
LIRARESDAGRDYATKLARRTINALLAFAKHRLYDELRSRRADELQYKERRVVLPADAEILDESCSWEARCPETPGVVGD